jgi:hypothetical protein
MKPTSLALLPLISILCITPLLAKVNIPTEPIKKMIVFIYAADEQGEVNKSRAIGTGFLVAVPRRPTGALLLLITVRHIVDPGWAFCSGPPPDLIYLRLNKRNYDPSKNDDGVDYVRVRLREHGRPKYWIRDDDDKIDAAVVDLTSTEMLGGGTFSRQNDDWSALEFSDIAAPDEIKSLDVGDSIVSAGLLPAYLAGGRDSTPLTGQRRNYPFFKFGEISNIPDESIWTSCDERMPALREEHVWFINANLVVGNSGSPIFFAPSGHYGGGTYTSGDDQRPPALIGIQSLTISSTDLAGMTPIEDVFKIIEKNAPKDSDLYRGDIRKHP